MLPQEELGEEERGRRRGGKVAWFNMEEREVNILKRYPAVTFITKTAPKLLNVNDKASLC